MFLLFEYDLCRWPPVVDWSSATVECVYVCMCVCTSVCARVCLSVCAVCTQVWRPELILKCSLRTVYFWGRVSHWDLGLDDLPRLAGIANCAVTTLHHPRAGTAVFIFAGHFASRAKSPTPRLALCSLHPASLQPVSIIMLFMQQIRALWRAQVQDPPFFFFSFR